MTAQAIAASSGQAPELAASLRPRHVSMISLGGIIGAGLFVGSSAAIAAAGPAVLLAYGLAGLVCLLVMRMLGEMAVARPGLGSFHAYIRASLGPSAAFVSGWLYWYFWVIVVGFEAVAGAALIHDWAPVLPVFAIGLGLIAAMTLTNILSVRSYGEFEFWFSLLKVGAIAAFAVGGIAWLAAAPHAAARIVPNLASHGGLAPHGLLAVLAAVPVVILSLTGSEIASIAAAESSDPVRNVTRAARTVALRIVLFYVVSIAVILCVVPWSAVRSGHSPFVLAMDVMGLPGGETVMRVVVLVAVLSCLNSALYVTSRTLHELAAAGDAPRALVRMGRRRVPLRAVLAGSVVGIAASIAAQASPDLVFAFLINTSGALILVIYAIVALAEIRMRQDMARRGERPSHPMWWFPWASRATIAANAGVLAAMAILPGQRAQAAASLGSTALVVVASRLRGHPRRAPD